MHLHLTNCVVDANVQVSCANLLQNVPYSARADKMDISDIAYVKIQLPNNHFLVAHCF